MANLPPLEKPAARRKPQTPSCLAAVAKQVNTIDQLQPPHLGRERASLRTLTGDQPV